MSDRRRTRRIKKPLNKTKIIKGIIEFVNFQTVRVRTLDGEIIKVDSKSSRDFLPGDEIEATVGTGRKLKHRISEVIRNKTKAEYQVVARVVQPVGNRKLVLECVGMPMTGFIQTTGVDSKLKPRQHVVARISRSSVGKDKGTTWSLIKVEKILNSTAEIGTAVALSRFGIVDEWSKSVDQQLQTFNNEFFKSRINSRRDLRLLPFVTIDPATAKDHDDAVYSVKLDSGNYRLFVAIADVSEFVPPTSKIDEEAFARGSSIYFPNQSVPMLPEKLSSELCSLVPNEDRFAVVCDMEISQSGDIQSYSFCEAVIRSHARLNYLEIADIAQHSSEADPIAANLKNLFQVHDCFLKAREKRGVLELELADAVIKLDSDGEVQSINPAARLPAHSLIEETMLAANVCAAKFINKHFPKGAMYRIHDNPSAQDLYELNILLSQFDFNLPVKGDIAAVSFREIFNHLEGRPMVLFALQIHILRSLATAVYSENNSPHFALNYPLYTHFTSPIRRYPDLIVHRLIKSVLNRDKQSIDPMKLAKVAKESSYLERRAEACAREAEKWLKTVYLSNFLGEEFDGLAVDVKRFGIFVSVESPYVDGMLATSELGYEYFHYSESKRQLIGSKTGTTYGIGTEVRIRVKSVNVELGFIDFELVR